MSSIKKTLFCLLAVIVGALMMLFVCGCAGPMYRTPCEHKVPMEEVNKTDGAVNICPICKKPFPYIASSRYRDDDDEIKWYDGLGWHWTGPYGRPYPYHSYGYGYENYHHAGCRCDDCYR